MIVSGYERAWDVTLPIDPGVDFPDVNERDGNLGAYVAKAAAAGWIRGYGNGTFRPTRPIVRLETALIAARALELPPAPYQPFADVSPANAREVGAVAAAGIMEDTMDPAMGQRLVRPGNRLTRAEAEAVPSGSTTP